MRDRRAGNVMHTGKPDRRRAYGHQFQPDYTGQGYDVTYFARKHKLSRQQARDLIRKLGHDRDRLNEAAVSLKA